MAFTSPTFIAFVIAAVLLTNAWPSPVGRSLVLLAANLIFIGSHVTSAIQLAPLGAFLLLCYLTIEAVRRSRSAGSLWVGLGLVVVAFIVLKRFSFLGGWLQLPFPYLTVGLSYVLFRVLHLTIDAKQGGLAQPISPLHFVNYTCNFLTFTAGPIQRYPDYVRQSNQPLRLDEDKVFHAFARVIRGFVKVGVVSSIFKYLFDNMSGRLFDAALAPSWRLFCGIYLAAAVFYLIHLYANFAGYVDIVIGVGDLLGQELPENFNHPFLARNFLDFWSRWHMTLSEWFKVYLFNPLLRALATRFTSSRAAPYLGVAAFFVTFMIMGLWHGTTSVFAVYGLLMGAGASANKLWQVAITKRLGKKRYKSLGERPLVIYLSRGLTLAYFTFALTCLWVDMRQLLWLPRRLGVVGVVSCYLGLAAGAGAAFLLWDTLMSELEPWRLRLTNAAAGVLPRNLALSVQILFVITVSSFFHKSPEFVYRAF